MSVATDFPRSSSRDWPGSEFYIKPCRDCSARFLGPKREPRCKPCHDELERATAPASVVHFVLAGLPVDMMPDEVPVLESRYFPASRRVACILTAWLSADVKEALHDVAASAGTDVRISAWTNPDSAWQEGRYEFGPRGSLAKRPLHPMRDAPRDGTPILLRFADRLEEIRSDLEQWNGLVFIGRNRAEQGGSDDWGFAAPVGVGGFPDHMLQGWAHLGEGIDTGIRPAVI